MQVQPEYKGIYQYADKACEMLSDEQLCKNFRKCYLNTLETTVKYAEDGSVFIITGDIHAMWLRDSSVQVSHYVRLVNEDSDTDKLIRSLLKRQFSAILSDPYANAFNESANGRGHRTDITDMDDFVWERKYEIDSLIYPLWLLNKYYGYSENADIFDGLFFKTYEAVLQTLICEQDYFKNSKYSFLRPLKDGTLSPDSLPNNGKGPDYAYTGMVRSAFRPSDDRCEFPFLVPANMFIIAVLERLHENLVAAGIEDAYHARASKLCAEIRDGIEKHAVINSGEFGRVYAYEVDGLGGYILMDDANVPSLLSLPYLGYCEKNDPLYLNTRKMLLSRKNPYYFEGKCAKGIGSPHTPDNYIWHIALIIEALTSDNTQDINRILSYLRETTADTGFMHEGFDADDHFSFTRSWFAWANTLFAIFIMDCVLPQLEKH